MRVPAITMALLAGAQATFAQSSVSDTNHPDARPRDPYVTSTGATVAKPGQSQSGGNTALDRKLQHENNAIDRSICKGC